MSTLVTFFLFLAVTAFFVVQMYNSLVSKKVQTDTAWSQIDVQLKRRYDLIPNLVETVKGYAAHEKETLEAVVQARNMAMKASGGGEADRALAENVLTGALKSLFALQEAYPDLKANLNFMKLQEELVSTENKVSFARQHYNDSAASYNTALLAFPSNIIGNMFNFEGREYFELDAGEAQLVKKAPTVDFSDN